MNLEEFLGLAIVSAVTSLLIKTIKDYFGTKGKVTKALTIGIALVIGGGYVWLRSTPYFETVLSVLTGASTVYAFFMK